MKPIFKLCYDYLMQLVLLESLGERLQSWGMSVFGEEQAPARSVPRSSVRAAGLAWW